MSLSRFILAHLVFTLAGCAGSHTLDPDADVIEDAGPRDAGASDSGPGDAGSEDAGELDGGPPPPLCAPHDARGIVCPASSCDGPDGWHWNGDSCFSIECGTCEGADCGRRFGSREECEAAHVTCAPALCRASGGTWMFWAEECGHRECGQPVPAICESGFAVCDCGPAQRFEDGVGCVTAECPVREPATPEELCTGTGGSWSPICCHTVCGEYCPLACANPACDCGPRRVFDEGRGCIESTECFERELGESCEPGVARCAAGTICCENCGGAGCFGARCEVPTCDDDPDTDVCGNNLLAP